MNSEIAFFVATISPGGNATNCANKDQNQNFYDT